MKHGYALLIKFLMVAVVLEVILLPLTFLSFTRILVLALTVTIVAYVIGDLMILPAFRSNLIATTADIALAFVTVYAFNWIYPGARISFGDSLISAAILGIGEFVFHRNILRRGMFSRG